MKAVVQRVKNASVSVDKINIGAIDQGLLVYLGVGKDDTDADVQWLAEKITGLRIFEDAEEKMNLSVMDTGGGIMIISQFTLFADTRKGKRPSYGDAASPALAQKLYEKFIAMIKTKIPHTAFGLFGAKMEISYTNMGPVTIILDTKKQP